MSSLLPLQNCFTPLLSDREAFHYPSSLSICHAALRAVLRSQRWQQLRRNFTLLRKEGSSENVLALEGILKELTLDLRPWRTGPIELPTLTIDAEWRSEVKWGRILPLLPDLKGKVIGDIGCSNGYFLFKLAQHEPSLVVGFDPVDRCLLQFALTQYFTRAPRAAFLPAGLDALENFPKFFDLLLCMGVIYHQRDPFSAVKSLYNALLPGGTLLLESLSIPHDDEVLLVPKDRYAKMRNAWTIPSPKAMKNLLLKAGFNNVIVHEFGPISTTEQRRTEFAHFESLEDFLDPSDPSKTVEGYPAPHSTLVIGQK